MRLARLHECSVSIVRMKGKIILPSAQDIFMNQGVFLISLDFELFWGVRDCYKQEEYGSQIRAVHQIVPRLVSLFETYGIHATFATVGMLMAKNKAELEDFAPAKKPDYNNQFLSPYNGYLKQVNEENGPLHFASELVNTIKNSGNLEIGTHTFSHFYCLEDGQNADQFEDDIRAAKNIARSKGIEIETLVFPRNQYNTQYLEICKNLGIKAFRGNEESWIYSARNDKNETSTRRAFRLIDAYINLSGKHTYSILKLKNSTPYNLPSSRFLRPFNATYSWFEMLRLHRITSAMTHAAKKGEVYHLWWHPHNFGRNTEANFQFLEKVLQHFKHLEQDYGFKSLSMIQLANQLDDL